MVGKILETLYSTFFTWCCFPYVHFWELYLSCVYCLCVFVVIYVYCTRCICCTLMCICCTSYVYLLYYVCVAVLTLDAGLLARSQYPEGPTTGLIDTGFSWFPRVYKRMLRWFPNFQVATTCLSCSPPDLNSLVTFFSFHICVHVK
jgi:hypothetical protein